MGAGLAPPPGDTGEMPFGVFEAEGLHESAVANASISFTVSTEPFLDFVPRRLFFCLNFSIQLLLFSF